MRCPSCAAEVRPSLSSCPSCGAVFSSQLTATLSRTTPADTGASPQLKTSGTPGGKRGAGAFVPGAILSGRYRIVAPVGHGGMGEVYRADDLRLGQTVALKFLPESLTRDPAALARVDHEVSIARQIAHPNVCRVFDVAESERGPFITMEFIDGEDLASLLCRIGRLPADKGLQIAHQLCAGLGAAHETGIVHRDLKPSNIMLDGRGKVRITDFGLAAVAHELDKDDVHAGTPDYMAPEQLAGQTVTLRTDVYSLGLVLYEVFTGAPAFPETPAGHLRKEGHSPARPSAIVRDINPATERVILRCLELQPQERPASATEVSAALPGGDRLRAGIAAGETPTPETVAAAGAPIVVSTSKAFVMLAALFAAMAGAVVLAGFGTAIGLSPADKSPDFLEQRAHDIIARFGYHDPNRDSSFWFDIDRDFLSTGRRTPAQLAGGPMKFTYRQSSQPMYVKQYYGVVRESDPAEGPGMFTVVLDTTGRLVEFAAHPTETAKTAAAPDWAPMLQEAGIGADAISLSEGDWVPPTPYDFRRTWQASDSGSICKIHAAALNGHPVYFRVVRGPDQPNESESRSIWLGDVIFVSTVVVLAVGGIYLARRNLRRGRGDRKGALRVAAFIFGCEILAWLFSAHHIAGGNEYSLFIAGCGQALYVGAFMWVLYLALEPYVRRRWPEMLISWTRVLAGQVRDTRVGRDVLAGAIAGAGLACLHHLVVALPTWVRIANVAPALSSRLGLRGSSAVISTALVQASFATQWALACVGFLLIATVVMRNWRIAVTFVAATLGLVVLPADNLVVAVPAALLTAATVFFLLFRFGLLSIATTLYFFFMLERAPLTLDFSRWYIWRSLFWLGLLAVIATAAFLAVLGERPIFNPEPDEL